MFETYNIIIALFAIRVFVDEIPDFIGSGYFIDEDYRTWKKKPFNCTNCLSIHTSIVMSLVLFNPIYLLIYFINKYIK
jgi:hypothetical protein|tara:strand:- start:812 stop:1045 length:234 start_codon:yes stop_codon:yes gene_type:complete